eukprot:TRINITY_DN1553_c0_g4_i1.p1 TRINITY_DN1553_c0_g4~~TRINITY_DN1553_c0_g4_i1.p1  ORF type:complete len:572 (+),score=85.24 TRINITY_DN1553_c0_g4_i1:47-1762(+)
MDSNTGSGAPQQTAAPKRERQRKWDVPSLAALQEDPLERARKMAEEIAMQLAAKNPSQTPATPTVIVREIDINDSRSRIILTKGATQQEIQRQSGASVITRGRYKPPGDTSNSTERPLYLHISSEKEEAVLKAVEIIEKYMQQGNNSNYAPHQQYNRPAINPQPNSYSAVPPTYATAPSYPSTTPYGASLHPNSDQPSKIFIGIDADPSFNLMYRLHGPDNSYLTHIQNETKVFVEIKGRGTGKDEDEPMHFSITASHANQAAAAKNLCESLLNSVWTAFQAHKAQMTQPPAAPSPQAPPGYPPGYATPGYQATPPPPPPGYPPGYVPPHINTPGYAHHPPHPHAAPYAHHPTYPAGYAPGYAHPHIHPHAQPSVPGYGSIPPPPAGPPPANLPPGYIVPPPVAPPPNPSSGRTSFSAVPPPPSYFKSGGDSDTAEKAKEESHEDDATPEVHIVPPPPMMPRLPSSGNICTTKTCCLTNLLSFFPWETKLNRFFCKTKIMQQFQNAFHKRSVWKPCWSSNLEVEMNHLQFDSQNNRLYARNKQLKRIKIGILWREGVPVYGCDENVTHSSV